MILSMNFDVVIIGGGLVGASLAAALQHSGLALALVESQPMPIFVDTALTASPVENWDSRMYAISPGSRSFLEQSGAWSLLDTGRIAAVETMRVFGDTGAELEFSAYQMGVAELACILESRALQQALWQILQAQENLTLLHPQRCASLQLAEDAATLLLENGATLNAKLIVGADGHNSWVRNQVGISATPLDYQQHGVVANFSTEPMVSNRRYAGLAAAAGQSGFHGVVSQLRTIRATAGNAG
jgi:2-octaprenylphenol hydroxylase